MFKEEDTYRGGGQLNTVETRKPRGQQSFRGDEKILFRRLFANRSHGNNNSFLNRRARCKISPCRHLSAFPVNGLRYAMSVCR